jgi:hypothetical protein
MSCEAFSEVALAGESSPAGETENQAGRIAGKDSSGAVIRTEEIS